MNCYETVYIYKQDKMLLQINLPLGATMALLGFHGVIFWGTIKIVWFV